MSEPVAWMYEWLSVSDDDSPDWVLDFALREPTERTHGGPLRNVQPLYSAATVDDLRARLARAEGECERLRHENNDIAAENDAIRKRFLSLYNSAVALESAVVLGMAEGAVNADHRAANAICEAIEEGQALRASLDGAGG